MRSGTSVTGNRFVRASLGFTLIEILVVLVIGVLLISVMPSRVSGGVSSAQVKASARGLAAALRFAHSRAIASHRETVVTVDVNRRRYAVTGQRRARRLPANIDIRLDTARSHRYSEHRGAYRFYPDGSATGGQITLISGSLRYVVDVNWLTGRIAIY